MKRQSQARFWVPSDGIATCMQNCGTRFSFFRRKHHCRSCGLVVCGPCSQHKMKLYGMRQPRRVCDDCKSELAGPAVKTQVKMVILGASKTGKSAFLRNYLEREGEEKLGYLSPLASSSSTPLNTSHMYMGFYCRFDIWDLDGHESNHRRVANIFYRDADVCVIAYDVTNTDSLCIARLCLEAVRESNESDSCVYALIGNKADLKNQRQVTFEQGRALAHEFRVKIFMETSAKAGHNVVELFAQVTEQIGCGRNPVDREQFVGVGQSCSLLSQSLLYSLPASLIQVVFDYVGKMEYNAWNRQIRKMQKKSRTR